MKKCVGYYQIEVFTEVNRIYYHRIIFDENFGIAYEYSKWFWTPPEKLMKYIEKKHNKVMYNHYLKYFTIGIVNDIFEEQH